jgi:hypothetical protein
MIILSRATKNLLAGFGVAFVSAFSATAPAQAQYGCDNDDDDWRPRRARTVVIEKSPRASTFDVDDIDDEPVFRRPVTERKVIIKQRVVQPVIQKTVVVQPVVQKTVVVEKPVVQRVIHRTFVKRPIYVTKVIRRPVHVRHAAFIEKRYARPHCHLPDPRFCW